MNDNQRAGTFSSSSAWKLVGDGKKDMFSAPGLKYIKQVKYEIEMGRPINAERESRPTSYGDAMEVRVFDLLPTSYQLVSKKRLFHKYIKEYSGAPDLLTETEVFNDTVADCKAPYSLEVFCDKIKALNAGIETYREEFPEDYWQHISNTILLESNGYKIKYFEAVIYCPYKSELDDIRQMVGNIDTTNPYKYKWIDSASDEDLPFIIEGGKYKNINTFKFKVPEEDKIFLITRIKKAVERLK